MPPAAELPARRHVDPPAAPRRPGRPRRPTGHELVVTTTGSTGYLAPGDTARRRHAGPPTCAYVADGAPDRLTRRRSAATVLRISTIFSAAWLASSPWASSSGAAVLAPPPARRCAVSALAIAASTPCSLMNSAHSTSAVDHLVLRDDGDVAAPHEQVAALVAGGDPEVGLAGLARSVDDAAHHRDLQRQLALAERLHRPLGDVDHVDLGPPARRAGDEVDVLALAQAERLEQLAAGPRLLDRVGGERVADRVADALEQQRGDAGRGLDQAGRRRPGLGDAEVQRVVGDLRRAGGRPRPSTARSTP